MAGSWIFSSCFVGDARGSRLVLRSYHLLRRLYVDPVMELRRDSLQIAGFVRLHRQ